MRRLMRTLLMLLIFAAIFPFTYPLKDGKPMLSWADLKIPSLSVPKLPEVSLPEQGKSKRETNQPVALYRWQAEDGAVQFSNEPPPAGVAFEVVEVNPDANLIAPPPAPPAHEEGKGESTDEQPAIKLPSPLTVSPGEAVQLMEDAHEIKRLSEERLRQQEAVMQQ